jgi:hypothetical protein
MEQTRKLELSLEPLKEVIEDMAIKIRQHLSNTALTGVARAHKEGKIEDFANVAKDLLLKDQPQQQQPQVTGPRFIDFTGVGTSNNNSQPVPGAVRENGYGYY